MTFNDFKQKVEALGLQAIECTVWHWQIKGGANTVNYYPTKGTIFINGTKQGGTGSAEAAMCLATSAPNTINSKVERRSSAYYKRKKLKMLARSNKCYWCPTILTEETATVDHRIPLKRGGSDLDDNLVLACEPCNQKRGHSMPELRKVAA